MKERTEEQARHIDRYEINEQPLSEEQEIYKENILDYYKYPRNKEELHNCSCKHRELNPLCGDEITIYLKIENNTITKAAFTGKGCAISQASISMLTEKLEGMKMSQAKDLKKEDIFAMLGIPISLVRMKCALLSLKTLAKALEEKQ
ncbi:SUF system NifU family Fe-S cluster assembly protein [Candidatus Woesearchaeota archaeon]|nr:SUF system NifU family Fe-S cluster assembly protein [Candidatus Woesearchaeota archaeon]